MTPVLPIRIVRICALSALAAMRSGAAAIPAIPPIPVIPGIFLTAPTAKDTAATGKPLAIAWAVYGQVGGAGFAVDLLRGGKFVKRITNAQTGDRSAAWIPDAQLAAGHDYAIRVWDFLDTNYRSESEPFTLLFLPPRIDVTAPGPRDTVATGSRTAIRWTSQGFNPGGARLYLLDDARMQIAHPVSVLGAAPTAAGSWDWTPADSLAPGRYFVYVLDTASGTGSAGFFFQLRKGLAAAGARPFPLRPRGRDGEGRYGLDGRRRGPGSSDEVTLPAPARPAGPRP